MCRGSRIKKIYGSNSLYNPSILNARRKKLRQRDYKKLKVIDIFRNLKIMPMRDFINLGLVNLNFFS